MILLFIALHFQFAISFLIPQWKELKENVEKVAELSKEHDERYIISLSNPNNPVFMYLTPCGAIVHWRLYRVKSDLTDISLTQPFTDLSNFELIAGEADDRRMKFFSHHVNADKILLVLSASFSASARIFISHSQATIDDFYPPLPHDLRVAHAISRQDNSDLNQALVTWKVSDGVRNAERNRYRFCAVVSRRYPDWAVCDQLDEGLESIHCISQSNNSIVVKNLRSGKHYFITVFVRDSLHGSTSSYDSLEVNLRKATEIDNVKIKKEEVHLLLDAVLQAGSVPARKSATVDYQFVLPSNSSKNQRVLLIVHACDGYVRMSVFRNGRLLKRSEPFSGFRRFLVLNVRSGQLRFQISNDDYRAKSIRMWASVRPDKSPYPMLPEDTSVKVVRRSCSTTTLQWLRSAEEYVEYCIYMRKENANYLEELVSRVDNLCEGGLASSNLVGCYSHRGPHTKKEAISADDIIGIIETTVNGLAPSSTYRFDLLATPQHRTSAQSLPYRTVWVRTTNTC